MVGISTASLEAQDGRPCGTGTSQASTWKVWDDQFFVSCLEPGFMMLEVTGDVSTHWIRQNTKLCALSVASFTQHLHQKPSTWFKCWVWPLFPTWTISFPHVKLSREYYCTTFHQGCKSLVRAEVPEMAVHYHGRVKRPMERAKRLVIHVFVVSLHLHPRLLALKIWIVDIIWYDIFLLGNRINSYRVLPFSFGLGMWKQLGHTKGRTFRTLVAYHVREELSGYFCYLSHFGMHHEIAAVIYSNY